MIAESRRVYGLCHLVNKKTVNATGDSASLLAQQQAIQRWTEWQDLDLNEILVEPADTPCYRLAFAEREKGGWLWKNLQRGDALIVTMLSGLGRDLHDCRVTIDGLADRGVRLVVLKCAGGPLDIHSIAVGKFVVRVLLAAAETKTELVSEHIRDALAWRREVGLPFNGTGRWGHRQVRDKNGKVTRLEYDTTFLSHMIRLCRDLPVKGAAQVAKEMQSEGLKDYRGLPFAKGSPSNPHRHIWQWAKRFRTLAKAGELPEPYCTLADAFLPAQGTKRRPIDYPRSYTPGGTVRREWEKAQRRANRQARWQAEKAARIQGRVHKPLVGLGITPTLDPPSG
jgi:DNA invertase Pin-like site-specific DNA recombinase